MHIALLSVIILLFATWVTVHVRLCVVLVRRSLRQGLVGLVVFPLAPYWGHQAAIPRLPALWGILAALYLLALTAGFI